MGVLCGGDGLSEGQDEFRRGPLTPGRYNRPRGIKFPISGPFLSANREEEN